MNLAAVIAPHLPLLRCFARALSGDPSSGDRLVASTLEALIADRSAIDLSRGPLQAVPSALDRGACWRSGAR